MDAPKTRRNTRQRESVQKALTEAPGPLSVQEILLTAGDGASLGIATVYRTLRLLEESGAIHPVALPDGEIRWEASDRGHHHHFHCRVCSRVLDLAGCPLHLHDGTVPIGFVVERHEVTLVGICPSCAAPKKPGRCAATRR